MNKDVLAYINKQKSPQKEILQKVRRLFVRTLKNCEESRGWGVLSLDNGRFYLAGLKDKVHVGFAINGLTKAEVVSLEGAGKTMRHIKIRAIKEIDEAALVKLIKAVHKKSTGLPVK